MAIALVGTASSTSNAATASVPLPSGYASGDLLIVLLNVQSPQTATTPTGWTALESNVANSTGNLSLYWRISDGTEGTSLSVRLNAAAYYNCISLAYSGTDTTSPINASAINADTTQIASGGGSTSNPGVTTTVANAMLVHTVSISDSVSTAASVTFTVPSGFTSEVTSPTNGYVTQQNASQMAQASAGATGTITSSYSISKASYYTTVLLALAPSVSSSGSGAATTTAPNAAVVGSTTSIATTTTAVPAPSANGVATADTPSDAVVAATTSSPAVSAVATNTTLANIAAPTASPTASGTASIPSSSAVASAQAPSVSAAANVTSGFALPVRPEYTAIFAAELRYMLFQSENRTAIFPLENRTAIF